MYENTPGLSLDDEHKYWFEKENVLGVSEVIVDNRLETDKWFTETDSSRGIVIHSVLAGVARGLTFDWGLLDPDLHGWVRSGLGFLERLKTEGATILGVEVSRFNPLYRIAGTLDLVVLWNGYEHVLDFKSGKASGVTRFRLGAYEMILGPTGNGKPRKKAAVELQKDGSKAKIIPYNGTEYFHDGARFLSYLTTMRDRISFGPKGE